MLESYKIINTEKWLRPFRHIYAMLVTVLAFVFFRAETLGEACRFIGKMFTPSMGSSADTALFLSRLTPMYLVMLAMAVIFSMPVIRTFSGRLKSEKSAAVGEAVSYAVSLVLLLMCILTLSSTTYNPFIYFRF